MHQPHQATARSIAWDDEVIQPRQSWLTRQAIAAFWILLAWAVGTVVFELGAIG